MLFKENDEILNKINQNKQRRYSIMQYIVLVLMGFVIGLLVPRCSYGANKSEILSYAKKVSSYYGIPSEIVPAVIQVESSFIQDSISEKGAVGLMQVMKCAYDDWYRRNPKSRKLYPTYAYMLLSWRGNVAVGCWYLKMVCYAEKKNWKDALSAYFWGPNHKTPTYTYYNKVAMNLIKPSPER